MCERPSDDVFLLESNGAYRGIGKASDMAPPPKKPSATARPARRRRSTKKPAPS